MKEIHMPGKNRKIQKKKIDPSEIRVIFNIQSPIRKSVCLHIRSRTDDRVCVCVYARITWKGLNARFAQFSILNCYYGYNNFMDFN